MPSLGVDENELSEALSRRVNSNEKGDPRVCVCGHPARCHTELAPEDSPAHVHAREAGRNICAQTRMACPCPTFTPVISVSDVRRFRYKTAGPASEHALSMGIQRTREKGGEITFLEGWVCRFCNSETEGLVPAAFRLSETGAVLGEADVPTQANALICVNCRTALRGS